MSASQSLIVCHLNLNSLTNKINNVQNLLFSNNIDLLGISETWLTSDIGDSFVNIIDYEIVRSDNPGPVRKHGVAMYIKRVIKFEVISCILKNVLIVYLENLGIYVITVYRPPSYNDIENNLLVDFIVDFCAEKEVIMQGDFNLPSLNWELHDIFSQYVAPLDNTFFESFINAGLSQLVRESTHFPSGNILNLFLTSNSERVGSCLILPPLPSCSHSPVFCSYVFQNLNFFSSRSGFKKDRLWTKGRYDIMATILDGVDWESELEDFTPNFQYNILLQILKPMIDRYVPVASFGKRLSTPWNRNPPRHLTREKSNLWFHYKSVRQSLGRRHPDSLLAWSRFSESNRIINNYCISCQKEYECLLGNQINRNPKLFHSYIKHRRVSRPSIGPIKTDDGFLSDDPTVMANCFAYSFASVFTTADPSLSVNSDVLHQVSNSQIETLDIDVSIVENILKSLDPNSSPGDDGIHPRMLNSLSSQLSIPLSIIFLNSVQSGVLPQEWLSSAVVPIYKKSNRYDPLNYRPVSLTSVPCKVLEKIVVNHIFEYLNENGLISRYQYGFRAGHSTVDQLIDTYNDITLMLDDYKIVDLVFFDFSKAFDTVCHSILLQKLNCIGIRGDIISWIKGFLNDRTMRVRVGDAYSMSVPVTSGVPQGSVLGPLLFLIYVNYTVANIDCYFKIFADDTKLYFAFRREDISTSIAALQANIDSLVNSGMAWGLNMNSDKCVVMRFGSDRSGIEFAGESPYKVNDKFLKFVASHSDLGITVDKSLKFHSHITRVVASMNGLTSNLLGCTLSRDPSFLMNVYTSHVRPNLEYASPLWNVGYLGDLRLLERIQRRWTRAVSGMTDVPYDERLRRLDLFSFKGRLLRTDLILVWKILNGKCAIESDKIFTFVSGVRRGHRYKIFVPRTRLEVRRRFFSVRVISLWNSLSNDTVTADNINRFKSLLKRDLGNVLYEFD